MALKAPPLPTRRSAPASGIGPGGGTPRGIEARERGAQRRQPQPRAIAGRVTPRRDLEVPDPVVQREGVGTHGAPARDRLDLPLVAQQMLGHERPVRADQVGDDPVRRGEHPGPRRVPDLDRLDAPVEQARQGRDRRRAARCARRAGGAATPAARRAGAGPSSVRRVARPAPAARRAAPNRPRARRRTAAAGASSARPGRRRPSRPTVPHSSTPMSGRCSTNAPSIAPRRPIAARSSAVGGSAAASARAGTSGSRIASWTASASARPAMMRPTTSQPALEKVRSRSPRHAFGGRRAHHPRRRRGHRLQAGPLGASVSGERQQLGVDRHDAPDEVLQQRPPRPRPRARSRTASSRNRPSTGAMRLTAVDAVPRSTVKNESGSELTDAW